MSNNSGFFSFDTSCYLLFVVHCNELSKADPTSIWMGSPNRSLCFLWHEHFKWILVIASEHFSLEDFELLSI